MQPVISVIKELAAEAARPAWNWEPPAKDEALEARVKELAGEPLAAAYQVSDKITLTGTYMSVNFDERSNVVDGRFVSFDPETSPPGTYDSFAHIIGFGFGYRF